MCASKSWDKVTTFLAKISQPRFLRLLFSVAGAPLVSSRFLPLGETGCVTWVLQSSCSLLFSLTYWIAYVIRPLTSPSKQRVHSESKYFADLTKHQRQHIISLSIPLFFFSGPVY